jgi:squalene-hopene/tetraprenyl-beta-curcumene cyclase
MFTRRSMISTSLVGASALLLRQASAQDAKASTKTADQIAAKAVEFLRTKGQSSSGAFTEQSGPAVTALVLAGVLKNGYGPAEPFVAKSLKYLETFVQPDGGIYKPSSAHQNYETSIAVMAFAAANKDGRYDAILKKEKARKMCSMAAPGMAIPSGPISPTLAFSWKP